MNRADVVTFDNGEANLEKEPKVFDELLYDNAHGGGVLNKLGDIKDKLNQVKSYVDELDNKYKELERLYDAFTRFNDVMDKNSTAFKNAIDSVDNKYQQVTELLYEFLNKMFQQDDQLMDDIDNLASLLGDEGQFKNAADYEKFKQSNGGLGISGNQAMDVMSDRRVVEGSARPNPFLAQEILK